MTVRELIAVLQRQDPDRNVVVMDSEFHYDNDIIGAVERPRDLYSHAPGLGPDRRTPPEDLQDNVVELEVE